MKTAERGSERSQSPPRRSPVQLEDGDLLECGADVLVQQCNCITRHSRGLSALISKKLHIDAYGHRTGPTRNLADVESSDTPGTIALHEVPPAVQNTSRVVACLYAQWAPGSSRKRYPSYERVAAERGITENAEHRELWFAECLHRLSMALDARPELSSVAFPHQIGCGLAGGDWPAYERMIVNWAAANPRLSVRIVRWSQQ